MERRMNDHYPALKGRRSAIIDQHVDQARRVLWRAYQRGSLSEDEFASTLDRLECESPVPEATPDR